MGRRTLSHNVQRNRVPSLAINVCVVMVFVPLGHDDTGIYARRTIGMYSRENHKLCVFAGDCTAGPCPMQVESAQVARDINNLARKEQAAAQF